MANIRVDLSGALAGHYVVINDEALTMGAIEDLQSDRASAMLDAMAGMLVEGDIPSGVDRAGLRKLTPPQFASVGAALQAAVNVPKAS